MGQELKLTKDLEAWMSIDFKKKINENYKFNIEQESRFNQSISAFKSSSVELELIRDCMRNFEVGINSRFKLFNRDNNNLENHVRYGVFARQQIFKTKLLKAYGMVEYQREYLTSVDDYNTYWKFKVTLLADLTRNYKPYFSSEIFRIQEVYRSPYFETYRMWLGLKSRLKKQAVSLALGFDHELNSKYPKTTWIIKLNYSIRS